MKKWLHPAWLKENEEGSVAVLVAVCMVVLLGFTSLAADYGTMAANRQSLQNAADSAALAGAMKLARSSELPAIQSEALSYAAKNGADDASDRCSVSASVLGNAVTVDIAKEVKMGFSMVLTGRDTETVSARATAVADTIFGNYPYALFAGQNIQDGTGIITNGQAITIKSPIHSNSNISMRHAQLLNGAVATAVGSTGHAGEAGWESAPEIPMPDYGQIKHSFPNEVNHGGNLILRNQYPLGTFIQDMVDASGLPLRVLRSEGLTIRVSGSITFHGNNSFANSTGIPINLIAHGNIDLGGCQLSSSPDAPFVIISEEGDITVNGGGAGYYGIVFAPKGDVTLNGNSVAFTGSVIAQNITKNGAALTVQYYDGADDFTPVGKVRLVS